VCDELRGRVVECSQCGRKVRVPQPAAAAAPARKPEPVAFVTEDDSELNNPIAATAARTANRPQSIPADRLARPAPATSAGGVAPHEKRTASVAVAKRAAERAAPAKTEDDDTAWHARSGVRKSDDRPRGSVWKWLLLVLVLLVPVGVVGVLILLPYLQHKDPRELVAERYLAAVQRDDWETANRLSVVKAHPRLVGVERVGQAERGERLVAGKFQGLAVFHARIKDEYTYNADIARFTPKNALGPALGALSALEQAKKKAEEKLAENAADPGRSRKSPEDQLLDDTIARMGAFGDLADNLNLGGLLSSQKLGPTYDDLLKQTDVPLSDAERTLATHYARDPAKWDRLLGRAFLDLPDIGEFRLQEVEIVCTIRTEGQSLGEPGRPITLRLVRFTMGSIDTGWRVWQAE
jgi:hypothetical protein